MFFFFLFVPGKLACKQDPLFFLLGSESRSWFYVQQSSCWYSGWCHSRKTARFTMPENVQKSRCQGKLEHLKMDFLLLMAEILHQLIGSLSHYLQVFLHPRWLFGISSINSTATYREGFLLVQCIWDCYCLLAGPAGASQFHGTWIAGVFIVESI